MSELDILDILLDYRTTVPLQELDETIPLTPGPNRCRIHSFSLSGTLDSILKFNDIIYSFTSLTSLMLNCWPYSLEVKTNEMEIDRILEAFPNLTYLMVRGCDYASLSPKSAILDQNGALYKLRSFHFDTELLLMSESSLQFFRRLGNLTSIGLHGWSHHSEFFLEKIQPQVIGRILKGLDNKIESIKTGGVVPLYLYLLPQSVEASSLCRRGGTPSEQQLIEEQQLLQIGEAEEIFPQLTTFIASAPCIMSGEDLRCLGLRAQFLTHVDLSSSAVDADVPYTGFYGTDVYRDFHGQVENGAQKRHNITSLDLQLFLESCQHLRHFCAERRTIHVKDMTPPDKRLSAMYYSPGPNGENPVIRAAKPWGCEATLEKLEIGFRIISASPSDHRIVFGQLGRCKRLKSLKLTRSNVIPTLTHGVDLLEGLSDSLEEVLSWSSSWACDDKETVMWMLTRLRKVRRMQTGIRNGSSIYERVNEWASSVGRKHVLHFPEY
ncbi:hypothetical protein BGZ80_009486 [Entomortierella chlamydospora]|uniref:Uncharacterized protein n=1 Tax=Entomortierella chlamydospora TaxID=101097 RepID=A0A9P6MX45_9FUNG|nr:hypothetical protein BGZ79_006546 [Entomortierella chlamydospora]KAG0016023.1 hypothetical protein BGZ80_009486 [Entomortierella chlamydospora]